MLGEKEQIKHKTKKVHKQCHGTRKPRKGWNLKNIRESDWTNSKPELCS